MDRTRVLIVVILVFASCAVSQTDRAKELSTPKRVPGNAYRILFWGSPYQIEQQAGARVSQSLRSEPWRIIPTWVPISDSQAFWRRVDREIYEYYQMDKCGDLISTYHFWPRVHLSKEQLNDNRICHAMSRSNDGR
jgi:hypothetical protein